MQRIRDLNDMLLFASVIEHGGYSAAARSLGLQVSHLSRRVTALEHQLGVRLLHRTTRRLALTDVGRTFHQHCLAVIEEVRAAQDAVDQTRASPHGRVRLSCPVGLLQSDVAEILISFLASNPEVRLTLEATNRRVDVVEEGFDLAILVRAQPLEDSDLVVRVLAQSALVLVGAPKLFDRGGHPKSLDELSSYPTLAMVRPGDSQTWLLQTQDGATVQFQHTPKFQTDDIATLRRAAIAGMGITYLPRTQIRADLVDGTLIRVLPELAVQDGVVHAVFPTRRGLVPAVRELIDALVTGFARA